jgi:hypothetical protein
VIPFSYFKLVLDAYTYHAAGNLAAISEVKGAQYRTTLGDGV